MTRSRIPYFGPCCGFFAWRTSSRDFVSSRVTRLRFFAVAFAFVAVLAALPGGLAGFGVLAFLFAMMRPLIVNDPAAASPCKRIGAATTEPSLIATPTRSVRELEPTRLNRHSELQNALVACQSAPTTELTARRATYFPNDADLPVASDNCNLRASGPLLNRLEGAGSAKLSWPHARSVSRHLAQPVAQPYRPIWNGSLAPH